VRRKNYPGREFRAHSLSRQQRKVGDNVKRNCRAFCESLVRSIHLQVIFATIERPSRTSAGAPSLVDALHLTNCPRPHNPILLHSETASICPRGRRLAGRGGNGRGASTIGARPDGTTCCAQAATYGIDKRTDMATSASAHHIGISIVGHWVMDWQQSEAEYRTRNRR
jgi:hypothetical protein